MEYKAKVNATEYAPKDKHPKIFNTFESLEPGEFMELSNDHDPRPLRYQLMIEYGDEKFSWEYLEEGPETWVIAIGKK
jgi:uncharacterized protein (DUF2249 family)